MGDSGDHKCAYQSKKILHVLKEEKMLKDKLEEIKGRGETVETVSGACRFCGQITTLEAPESWSGEELDELATELCKCEDAASYIKMKKRKENAIKAVYEQYGEKGENCRWEILKLLEDVVNEVAEMMVESVTVGIAGNLKAKISMNSKGNIKVEKTKTRKETREV